MDTEKLSISLFGAHLLRYGDRAPRLGIRGKTLELLQFLILHAGHELRREYIAEQFWCESSPSRQRSALNSALWRINKHLDDYPGILLQVTGSSLCLELENTVNVDTRQLTDLVHQGTEKMTETLADQLACVLVASEDPFMNGLVPDWALAEQERVFNIRMRGLILLMHWYGDHRCYEDALEVGRRLLSEDPFRETVQIDMMWLYVLNGQRAAALKQYQHYADLLERELAIQPMAEMQALYEYIRSGMNQPPSYDLIAANPELDEAQNMAFDAILESIELSRRELYLTLRAQLGSS